MNYHIAGNFRWVQFSRNGNLAVPELLRLQYLVDCASYRMCVHCSTCVRPGMIVCTKKACGMFYTTYITTISSVFCLFLLPLSFFFVLITLHLQNSFTACTRRLKNSRSSRFVRYFPLERTSQHKSTSLQPLHSQQCIFLSEIRRKLSQWPLFCRSELSLVSIARFTSELADSMDDDGTVINRGPCGSGSLVISLDALKQCKFPAIRYIQCMSCGEKWNFLSLGCTKDFKFHWLFSTCLAEDRTKYWKCKFSSYSL